MAPDSSRCSVASALRDEPLAGSAPQANRWVLIEHPGPWAKDPLETVPLAGDLAERLAAAADAHQAKVLLVRRTGRQPEDDEPRVWRVVDVTTRRSTSGSWVSVRDLNAALEAVAADDLDDDTPPMILVCTHGVRDVCCALKGRPIAGMLSRAFPGEVWECSHLNGHRFAGTALVLPDGACYGRMDQSDAVRILTQHRVGRIDPAHLRGLVGLSPAAQAAQAWGLGELLRATPDAPRSPETVTVGAINTLDEDHTAVKLLGLAEVIWVQVARSVLPPAPLSCGKGPEEAAAYRVIAPATPAT